MAKKKETGDKEKKSSTTGAKGNTATGKSAKKATASGKVKGLAGTADKKKPQDSAKAKNPAKVNQPAKGRFSDKEEDSATKKSTSGRGKKASEETKNLPKPKKALPKQASKKASTKSSEEKKTSSMGTSAAKSAASKGPAKKMARRKIEEGVSAEEKMKMPNTSPNEDLKDTAKATLENLKNTVLPDEKTQKELKKKAKEILPDQEEVKKTAQKIAGNATDTDKLNKAIEKIIPDEKVREKIKKKTFAAKEAVEKAGKTEKSKDKPVEGSLLSDYDVHLFREGKHFHLYKKLGSHLLKYMGTPGVYFALWAPNARQVHVIGDFNDWDKGKHPMVPRQDESGIWEVFIPEAKKGSIYKYFIQSNNGYEAEKGDPYAFLWEVPPHTASIVWDLEAEWKDNDWLNERKKKAGEATAVSVYELHMASWKRVPEDNMRSLTYREMAKELPVYLKEMGFTHVEFMPVMEHPFGGSWGYQITGYFAPSSRFGSPQDFMHLIDALHQAGIGVILDWVPSHFPSDLHGLHYFDGTFLYEHADPRKGFHPDWQSYIFNYGRNEVRSFLISNAVFWLDKFHIDGLRVDAVASMLYLDYSRKEGEWEPNEQGGRENLEAISFLKEFNETVYSEFPDIVTIAEESTAWPMVSKPTYMGGLGFGMKWMMGWMHDTLEYFKNDPIHRRHHQNTITFSTTYAFSESFMLPLSHDEVVYGKQPLINKMPGDEWNKFANLRNLYAYMYAHPGTKLLFMGAEFGQTSEWNHDSSLDWHLTDQDPHRKMQETLKALNHLYKSEPALYEKSFEPEGFEWVDINDAESSVVSFLRKGSARKDDILIVCNFTPVPRENYRIGVPAEGNWEEIFNSDDEKFGGSNIKNEGGIDTMDLPTHGKNHSVALKLPPLGVLYLKRK